MDVAGHARSPTVGASVEQPGYDGNDHSINVKAEHDMQSDKNSPPLSGLRVVEMAGMGPGPHAAMQLADLGAEVVRIERPGTKANNDILLRHRTRIQLDLRSPEGLEATRSLLKEADVVIEGFRPGVMERLDLGPDTCLELNPRLIYGRMTGWGQSGPLALRAGHDINYVALTGVLDAIGASDQPPPVPLNVIGDFGGGSMFLVVGILAALWERSRSGAGQVVDAAMVDGVGILSQMMFSFMGQGTWQERRESNLLDGGAPYYRSYRCADGLYVAVGAIEMAFYENLLRGLGVSKDTDFPVREKANWAELHKRFEHIFATRSRDEWAEIFQDLDACVTPVLSFSEATQHPHAVQRQAFATVGAVTQVCPAPRFGRTSTRAPQAPDEALVAADEVLARWAVRR